LAALRIKRFLHAAEPLLQGVWLARRLAGRLAGVATLAVVIALLDCVVALVRATEQSAARVFFGVRVPVEGVLHGFFGDARK
jgi:hypothetical protein